MAAGEYSGCWNKCPESSMSALARVQTREQISDVANLAREVWTEHYASIVGQEQVDYMLGKFQSAEAIAAQLADGYEYFTVSAEGRTEGYMALIPEVDDGTCMLSKLYVRQSGRGHGFGRVMLEGAVGFCRERRIGTIWLTVNKNNTDSLAWYLRMGFRNVGSIVQDIGGGFVMDDYRMEKSISQPAREGLKTAPKKQVRQK